MHREGGDAEDRGTTDRRAEFSPEDARFAERHHRGEGEDRDDQPGAGVFPIVAGCVLIAASLSAIWEGVRLDPLVTVDIPTGADLKRLLSLVALLIAFVIAIPLLGQLIASVIFCILLMRCLSDLGWVRIVASSLLVCGGLYVAFVMVLKVPLPGGLLSP